MIASGYSLHLYCDTPGCPNGQAQRQGDDFSPPGNFSDEERSQCYRYARIAGWIINRGTRTCVCPKCAKAGINPPAELPD